jgi:hypothetical protein
VEKKQDLDDKALQAAVRLLLAELVKIAPPSFDSPLSLPHATSIFTCSGIFQCDPRYLIGAGDTMEIQCPTGVSVPRCHNIMPALTFDNHVTLTTIETFAQERK